MKAWPGRFSNGVSNLRQIARSPASWSFAILILAVQLAVTLAGGKDGQPAGSWFEMFGLSREGVLSGKIWQLVSYGFLHGGWWHAGLNAAFILLIGSRTEHMVGSPTVIKVMVAGLITGGVFHLLFSSGLLVGISGGCMALLLLLTTLSPQSRMMPLPVSARILGAGIMAAELILTLVDPALGLPALSKIGRGLEDLGLGSWFQLGHACHFGGGLVGWVTGRWLLRPRISLKRLRRDRLRREAKVTRELG